MIFKNPETIINDYYIYKYKDTNAFDYCESLESIEGSNLYRVENHFCIEKKKLFKCLVEMEHIEIPASINSVSSFAFNLSTESLKTIKVCNPKCKFLEKSEEWLSDEIIEIIKKQTAVQEVEKAKKDKISQIQTVSLDTIIEQIENEYEYKIGFLFLQKTKAYTQLYVEGNQRAVAFEVKAIVTKWIDSVIAFIN